MAKDRRAVFDTNILISAYLWPGVPRNALEVVRQGLCALVSAWPAVEEFVRVLGYRKFGLSPREIEPLVSDLLSLVTLVSPRQDVHVVAQDPSDNLFIAIALEGHCPLIVSGDHHLLGIRQYEGIRVVSAPEFMMIMQTPEP
jgi:putative PIN family toxin of toxin-antitoxin system